jgi:uncharacterized membrane protein YcaP (DUF421 family)
MEWITNLLGLEVEPKNLTIVQVALRGMIILLVCIVMVRVGDKRFLSKKSALDAVLGFILASMMARAVNGSSAFLPTICGGFVIVFLHRGLSSCARRSHWIGTLVKGTSEVVIENGEVKTDVLRRNDFSEGDLLEDLRVNGGVASPEEVKLAHIERNGDLSVIKK